MTGSVHQGSWFRCHGIGNLRPLDTLRDTLHMETDVGARCWEVDGLSYGIVTLGSVSLLLSDVKSLLIYDRTSLVISRFWVLYSGSRWIKQCIPRQVYMSREFFV